MNLQEFPVGMADKGPGHRIRLFARSIRRHVFGLNIQRFTSTYVANLTTVDDIGGVHAYLVTEYRVVEVVHLADQSIDLRWAQSNQMVLEIVVSLLCSLGRFFEKLGLSTEEAGLLFPQIIEELLELIIIQFLGDLFSRTVSGRQFHVN